MTDVVNWGVLGGANFAARVMAPAIHEAKGARLAALATSSAEKAAQFTAFCPDIAVHDSYDSLLADPGIDAVYIPLPNHLHVEWALRALEAGKAVLCEKPVGMTVEEVDRLIAKRDETGLFAAEAYMITHHPQWTRARDIVQSGRLGDLVHVAGHFSYFNADMGNIRNKPETGGGGVRDIGVYPYGATRFVTGEEPGEITADITRENGVDTHARVSAAFPSFQAVFTTSTRMALFQEMRFHGTEATLILPAPFNAGSYAEAQLILRGADGNMQVERFPDVRQYVLQVEAFGRALREGADYPWTLEMARGTQVMIDRILG